MRKEKEKSRRGRKGDRQTDKLINIKQIDRQTDRQRPKGPAIAD